jgi:hypothetical protein
MTRGGVGLSGRCSAARTDIYATRIENSRTGWRGWLPAVCGGWQRGIPHERRVYLPLTMDVPAAHLKGDGHVGVYPLLDGDRCWWLAEAAGTPINPPAQTGATRANIGESRS